MSSTYLSLHRHIVFGTKIRQPLIRPEWQPRLHDHLGSTIRGLGGIPQAVGGIADHVHLLIGLKATHCLADVMRELKKASSTWAQDEIGDRAFAWQERYAAFTVSATARAIVRSYLENQAEHHRKKTFREELLEMLQRPRPLSTRNTLIKILSSLRDAITPIREPAAALRSATGQWLASLRLGRHVVRQSKSEKQICPQLNRPLLDSGLT